MKIEKLKTGLKFLLHQPLFYPTTFYFIGSTVLLLWSIIKISNSQSLFRYALKEHTKELVDLSIKGVFAPVMSELIKSNGKVDELNFICKTWRSGKGYTFTILFIEGQRLKWKCGNFTSDIKKILSIHQDYAFLEMGENRYYLMGRTKISKVKKLYVFVPISDRILTSIFTGLPFKIGLYHNGELLAASSLMPQSIEKLKNELAVKIDYPDGFTLMLIPSFVVPFIGSNPLKFALFFIGGFFILFLLWSSLSNYAEAIAYENVKEKHFLYHFASIARRTLVDSSEIYKNLEDSVKLFIERYGLVGGVILDADFNIRYRYPEEFKESWVVKEIDNLDFKKDEPTGMPGLKYYNILIPIPFEEGIKLGWILLFSDHALYKEHPVFNAAQILGTLVGLRLAKEDIIKLLDRIALIDSTTYVFNMKYFIALASEEIKAAYKTTQPLSLMMLQIDDFDMFVSHYSEKDGEKVLRAVGILLSKFLRKHDLIARAEKDTFVILLPKTNLNQAFQLARKLKGKIELYPFPREKITLSIGVSSLSMFTKEDLKSLYRRAQEALKIAILEGGNKIVTINPDVKRT